MLAVASAAVAYLSYHALASGGGFAANMAVTALAVYFIVAWSDFFYRLGRGGTSKIGGEGSRAPTNL